MPPIPQNDQKLRELSLSSRFNALNIRSQVSTVQTPAPRTAKALVVNNSQSVVQDTDVTVLREAVNNMLIVVKKALNSNKLSDEERSVFRRTVQEMSERSLSSNVKQLETDLKALGSIKLRLI